MYGIWNRLLYMMTPQFDIYEKFSEIVSGWVADIGSGTGFGTHLFTRNAKWVEGIDIDPHSVDFAKRCFENGKITFSVSSIEDFSKRQASPTFDYVTMVDVIEHIKDDFGAIKNCRNLLNGDGVFLISTPNKLSRYRKSDNHVREYSPDEMRTLLEHHFKAVELLDFNMNPIETEFENPIIGMCRC